MIILKFNSQSPVSPLRRFYIHVQRKGSGGETSLLRRTFEITVPGATKKKPRARGLSPNELPLSGNQLNLDVPTYRSVVNGRGSFSTTALVFHMTLLSQMWLRWNRNKMKCFSQRIVILYGVPCNVYSFRRYRIIVREACSDKKSR